MPLSRRLSDPSGKRAEKSKELLLEKRITNKILCIALLGIIFSGWSFQSKNGNISGKVLLKGKTPVSEAVVYIDKIPGRKFQPPEEPAVMDQRNLKFIPHVLPILVGTTVYFLNNDNVLHNVFSPDPCAGKLNLGTWFKGEVKKHTFTKPCVVTILCNVHPEMEAYIIVLETPYFALTDKEGNFTIKDVPPGEYTLKVWHNKFKGKDIKIKVGNKGTVYVDLTVQ